MFANTQLPSELSRGRMLRVILCIVAIGLLVRMLGGVVFNYGYDVHHWAEVMSVISSGNGLYGLTGYFYTPVWGYILGFINAAQQFCLTLGDTAYQVAGALCFEQEPGYISANTTSLAYTFWVKLPLYLVDIIVAYVLYVVVLDYTGDKRKALIGFALWFLNPLVISAPMVQGMFDNIAALMTLLCFFLLRKGYSLGAGVMLVLATLLKLFPVFLAPLLIAYLLVKYRGEKHRAISQLAYAIIGAVLTAIVVFIPQVMDGTLGDCFTFITARTAGTDLLSSIESVGRIAVYILILFGSIFIALTFYRRSGTDVESDFLNAFIVNMVLIFLFPPTPQYLVLLVPFLIIFVLVKDQRYMRPFVFISLMATIYVFSNGMTLFLTLANDTSWISVDTVVTISLDTSALRMCVYYGAGVLQYLGILYLLYLLYRDRLIKLCFWKGKSQIKS